MTRFGTCLLFAVSLLVVFGITACGSNSSRQLESIAISPSGNFSILQYTATGTFNKSPTNVTPLPVSWYLVNTAVNPAINGPVYGYSLTTQPFAISTCAPTDTVVALAPADPNAPTSGALTGQVYQDLVVAHTVSKEEGFVAEAVTVNCTL